MYTGGVFSLLLLYPFQVSHNKHKSFLNREKMAIKNYIVYIEGVSIWILRHQINSSNLGFVISWKFT